MKHTITVITCLVSLILTACGGGSSNSGGGGGNVEKVPVWSFNGDTVACNADIQGQGKTGNNLAAECLWHCARYEDRVGVLVVTFGKFGSEPWTVRGETMTDVCGG